MAKHWGEHFTHTEKTARLALVGGVGPGSQ